MTGSRLKMMRSSSIALLILVLFSSSCGQSTEDATTKHYKPFLKEFQIVNSNIAQVRMLEIKSFGATWGTKEVRNFGLFWACNKDRHFRGDFSEELFGVFLLDELYKKPIKVIKIFNTRRWLDYTVTITDITWDSITVEGKGTTYGDQAMTETYKY